MDYIIQWATILSPVIAIIIAVISIRSGAKDTNKKIAAIDESSSKQVESLKELTKMQLELSIMHINEEIWETRTLQHQIRDKEFDMAELDHSYHMASDIASAYREKFYRESDLKHKRDFYQEKEKTLEEDLIHLKEILNKLGGL